MLIYHVKHIIVISEERQFVKNYAIFSFVLEDKNTPKEKIRKHIHRKILSLSLSLYPLRWAGAARRKIPVPIKHLRT